MPTAQDLIKFGETLEGHKYVFGTAGPNTFDCSGLMQYIYHHFGLSLPRTTSEQVTQGRSVATKVSAMQPGDLVFSSWDGKPHSHVGMYVGGGKILVAPHTGDVVKIQTLNSTYMAHVDAVRRIPAVRQGASGSAGAASHATGDDLTDAASGVAGAAFNAFGGGALVDAVKGVSDALGGVATGAAQVGKLAELIGKLALPTTMVRAASGALGVGFLLVGITFLLREVKG